jgi:phosphate:Na+ symporter
MQLSDHDIFRLSRLVRVVSNFERIGDHAENVVEFAERLKNAKAVISPAGTEDLKGLSDAALETLDVSMKVFENEDFSLLPKAEALEQRVDDMQEQCVQNHIERLMKTACNPLSGVIFTDMCTDLERCSDQAINVATALYHPDKQYTHRD